MATNGQSRRVGVAERRDAGNDEERIIEEINQIKSRYALLSKH